MENMVKSLDQVVEKGWNGSVLEDGKQDDSKLEDSFASISFAPSNREPLSGQRSSNFLSLFFLSLLLILGLLCFWTLWLSHTISNVLTYGVGRVW